MPHARPRRFPVAHHVRPTPASSEVLFPRAVPGEQYPRYAKSVWMQAQRWLTLHWSAATHNAATALDVRLRLRAIAATDVHRHLYAQEEQLLSEIVQVAWEAAPASTADSREDVPRRSHPTE